MDPMIAALLQPAAYDHPVGRIELIETHISWVLLTGAYAYKLKKPVELGFVDFSTPERRRWFCEEELRLNRRLAPDLYIGLRIVHGPPAHAALWGTGPPIEVAVQMHQFPQEELLPAVLERGDLPPTQLDQLADTLVSFHRAAALAEAGEPYGTPEAVQAPAFANLDVLQSQTQEDPAMEAGEAERLCRLRRWCEAEAERLGPFFAERRAVGCIRECHGDLHLGNMVRHGGRIEVFDCLEFSPALRWIDPISDMAFLVMDLEQRGSPAVAHGVLNRWLEGNGDYAGLPGWRWYLVYRALVRAKVTSLRLHQGALSEAVQSALQRERAGYLAWAEATTAPSSAALVITHGVSGSGKTHLARRLCERMGWVQLRSDLERLRQFGRWGLPTPAGPDQAPTFSGDPYREEVTEWLYGARLVDCAEAILSAGLSLIVDATFLKRRQRRGMAELAARCGVGFAILDCRCSPDQARRRIRERRLKGEDPSEADAAVLESQLLKREPLEAWEEKVTIVLDSRSDDDATELQTGELVELLRTTLAG
jgi:aminoglycoside phosphotransferase family enzyme/predicted kinase